MDVSVRLLGTPAIGYRGEWLEVPAGKTSGLLYYLAYQGGWVEREDLLYLLWPDTPQKNAQDNLKQRVYETVHERPFAADLESERFRVRWQVSSDVETFRDHITNGRWCEAAQQYRGNLLGGLPGPPNARVRGLARAGTPGAGDRVARGGAALLRRVCASPALHPGGRAAAARPPGPIPSTRLR